MTGGHLLHIGYPKPGSKYLQRWFAAHSGIAFSEWGIAGFGDAHAMMVASTRRSPAAWHLTSHEALLTPLAEYRDLGADGIRLPNRSDQRAACAMLAKIFPASRILIVTRGHEALLRSFYAELVVGGAGYGFADFCDALLAQVEAGADTFDFDAAIDAYAEAFGEAALLVLPYELLRDTPSKFLGAIEEFLGLEHLPFESDPVRRSPSTERLAAYRRVTRWIRALPGPARLRRGATLRYIAALRRGDLGRLAAAVERLGGATAGDGAAPVPPRLLEALAARTGRLRSNPRYRDYAPEYGF
jgi:hypothetical protein